MSISIYTHLKVKQTKKYTSKLSRNVITTKRTKFNLKKKGDNQQSQQQNALFTCKLMYRTTEWDVHMCIYSFIYYKYTYSIIRNAKWEPGNNVSARVRTTVKVIRQIEIYTLMYTERARWVSESRAKRYWTTNEIRLNWRPFQPIERTNELTLKFSHMPEHWCLLLFCWSKMSVNVKSKFAPYIVQSAPCVRIWSPIVFQ